MPKSRPGPRGKPGRPGKTGPRGPRGKRGPAGSAKITRHEFDAAVESITSNIEGLQVQLRRIAQLQAEVDGLKRIVARLSAGNDDKP